VLRALVRHWELKLLSLVVAVTLWFFVVGGEKSEIMLSARLEYVNLPPGLTLVGPTPETIDVLVQGVRTTLARLTPEDLRAEVNLARLRAGEAVVQLVPDSVLKPRGVSVLRLSPSRVHLALEPIATAEVRVVPRLTGTPEPGYRVGAVSITPPTVEVRGPRSEVASRAEIHTSPIDVSGARGPITRSVALAPAPGAVRLTKTRAVDVTVEIREQRVVPQNRPPR